ncbi:MAG: hypothetical protein C5B52_10760 [Bacteroidetes bacterium]|nr:MAG: hypothetical protein C5B52_10760 [Bacteroidota bacterium]
MTQSRFKGLLFCSALAFIFASCGSGSEKSGTADTTATDTTAKTPPPPPPSTIVTTPTNMATVVHKVANYAKWFASYEAGDSSRLAHGVHNYVIGRGFLDSNMVLVAVKIDDTAKAMAFWKSPDLQKSIKKSGIIGQPMMTTVTATWQDTATISTKLRSRTTFMVKDWDAWVKAFEEGKQERLDNGITDRVIGHDWADTKKVSLVTAITDTAKAFAYYKSDALKKRRAASGVVGEPQRFLFNIVKRY